jgi:hypothetical protein
LFNTFTFAIAESKQMLYNLNTERISSRQEEPAIIKFFARFFSFIFHPLFISSYTMGFLIFIHPAVFTGFDNRTKLFRFLSVLLFTCAFPAFSVFIGWRLKLIKSIQVPTVRDRIIPYVIAMFFYWWTWNVFKNLPDSPPVTVRFLLGSFLAICGAWMCNIFFKISMHAVAAGGLLMFILLFAMSDNYGSGLYLSVAVLLTGVVCTSRLIASDHSPFELYSGLLVGLMAELISWQFY